MRSKSLFAPLAVLATVSGLALAGCSGDNGGGTAAPSAASSDQFTGRGPINYVSSRDASGAAQESIARWNKAHPDEKVTWIELPDSADQQRQQMVQNAQIKSDTFGVLNLDTVWTTEFAANRWISALPKTAVPTDKMLKGPVEAATYRDMLFAAPYYTDGALLYQRSDLMKAAGVAEAPKTWADMEAACQKILALPQAKGMSCYTGQFDKNEALTVNFTEAVASAGGKLFTDEGKPNVNTPEALAGLTQLKDAFTKKLVPNDAITYLEEQGRRSFQEGKVVFMRNWPFVYASLTATDGTSKVKDKFEISAIPGIGDGKQGVSTLGGRNLAVSAFTKNKATALDFITFFTSEEESKLRVEKSSRAPVYPELLKDKAVVAKRPFYPTLLKSLENAQPRPKVVQYGATTQVIQQEAYAALTGEKEPKKALEDMQSKLEELAAK
ncbi:MULTISPECIES: ABC transporter substrate-binding protein [unclassified Luteococcus]|uniref:ABC transporter substrate-binding protein n=1 Tax=unclassified Luteococcus TaxID=2639923 RepID=UPI00313B6A9F